MLRSSNVTSYIFIIVYGSLLICGKEISESCIRNARGIIIDSTFYTLPLFNERSANDAREFCRLAGSNISNFRSAEARELLQDFLYRSVQKQDINILTGIRSDYNQRKWYYNGESEASDLDLPDSDLSTCEQMTWQLRSFSRFAFSPIDCANANRRFLCEYPIIFHFDQIACFSTALRLWWKFEGVRQFESNIEFTARVFLESGHSLRNDTFHLSQSEFIIGQLREDSIYAVQIFSNICFENRIAALTNRTGSGAPGTVPNPRVLEYEYGTNHCIIAWYHDYFRDRRILVYKIIATNNIGSRQEILVSTSTNPSQEDRVNQQHSYKVILNEDLLNTNVRFTIQGITCEFEGKMTSVGGNCVVFDAAQNRLHVSPQESVSMFVMIGVIFAIAFLVSLACKAKQEKRKTEQKSKTWNERKRKQKPKTRRPSIRNTENYYNQSVYSIDDYKATESNYYEHYENQEDDIYENTNGKRKTSSAIKLSEEDTNEDEN